MANLQSQCHEMRTLLKDKDEMIRELLTVMESKDASKIDESEREAIAEARQKLKEAEDLAN